ncbi:hypothetical protein PaeCFBP13512_02670 [Paenibacillus sp. CFBP13512]|uniref:hypothetical protein n=1 Tax=Paenibacillus sp. CFBP13512 TaxID=2184007 RepID=UPI0010BF6810|nr:hypothetical protein [Paenibacillus sp. CFBP13512]TKJ93318.1 hypothetical protein PaeCFBP13512_02670 [Paenibacillus sp. CFBP13512]
MFNFDPNLAANRIAESFNTAGMLRESINKFIKLNSVSMYTNFWDSATASAAKTAIKISQAKQNQEELNKKVVEGTGSAVKLGEALKSVSAQAWTGLKFVGSYAKDALISAGEDQSTKQIFISRAGNPEVGGAMFEQFKQDAIDSGANVKEALKGSQIFMSGTENTDQIRDLNSLTVRLQKLSGTENSESEIAKIIYGGMKGREAPLTAFNIPATAAENDNLMELGKAGNIDGYITAMNEIMTKRGMTEEALKTMMDAPTERWGTLMTNFKMTMIDIGLGALTALLPLLDMLNTAFQAGTFQPFFDMLTNGLALVSQGFVWLITNLPVAWQVIVDSISVLGNVLYNIMVIIIGLIPFILALAVMWLFLNAAMIMGRVAAVAYAIGANIAAVAQRIFNLAMSANPLGIIIALILGVVTAFFTLGSIAGGVKEVLSNAFGFIMDCAENAVNFILAVINAGIKGINAVSGFFADLLGIESKEIPLIEATADFSGIKKSGQNFIKDFSMDKLTNSLNLDNLLGSSPKAPKDTSAASQFKQELPKGAGATMPSAGMPSTSGAMPAISSPTMPATVDNVNNVNNVGNIEGTVDISSEDLKMMRDLAELQAIQNFVSLTPTVQVTTGDINSGADLDTIVGHIGRKLEEEFVSTAQGVYI